MLTKTQFIRPAKVFLKRECVCVWVMCCVSCAHAGGYDLPVWVWLSWLPQLMMSLARPEAPAVKPILKQLAQSAPQAIYYPLRVFLLALREAMARLQSEGRHRQQLLQQADQIRQAQQAKYTAAQQQHAADPAALQADPEASE